MNASNNQYNTPQPLSNPPPNVITQSQSVEPPDTTCDDINKSTNYHNGDNNMIQDYYDNYDYNMNTPLEVEQTPIKDHSHLIIVPSPVTFSPTKQSKPLVLDTSTTSSRNKKDPSSLHLLRKQQTKRYRVTYSAQSLIFNFLRDNAISEIKQSTNSLDIRPHFKLAQNHFVSSSDRTPKMIGFPKPYVLKKTLSAAPYPLTHLHHRLLLEDIMLLEKDTQVILLISSTHPFITNEKLFQKWQRILLDSWNIKPFQPVHFSNTMFYAISATVSNNPNYWGYYHGTFTESEIIEQCTNRGGAGIVVKFEDHQDVLLKFHEFITR